MTRDVAGRFIGTSSAVRHLTEELAAAARSDAKTLITGESGSGKEVAARLIHAKSRRREEAFVAINCAGVPETLLESELFGHTRGSFTGAYRDREGRLEAAHHGSIFLDEIGEMSLRMQGLLLRFLETGEVQRVGSARSSSIVDARIIAATNVDLARAAREKRFREDLFYRLNVIQISVPPLRERREDVEPLLDTFLDDLTRRSGIERPQLTTAALERLVNYDWPGNVRELRNMAERLAVSGSGRLVTDGDLPAEIMAPRAPSPPAPVATGSEVERLFQRMAEEGESFWSAVYDPFILRDLTRSVVRGLVQRGLKQTRGSYPMLLELFNIAPGELPRFLSFLRQYHCHQPARRSRSAPRPTI
jgi:transcriptional regulator with PAS, ATPase and Fis domain